MKIWNTFAGANLRAVSFAVSLRGLAALAAAVLLVGSMTGASAQKSSARRAHSSNRSGSTGSVTINGVRIGQAELDAYAQQFGKRIPSGQYWYDADCGAWGKQGGPTLGFTLAGLPLGGPMRSDASHGNTGVFINGRQLPWADVRAMQQIGLRPQRGRAWLNAYGDFGAEGNPTVWGNVVALAQQARRGRSYGSVYSRAAEGSVTSNGDGTYSASFRDGHGGYIGHNSGD